ncbi:anti-sigma factor family protein [Roseinatronobacter sp.]
MTQQPFSDKMLNAFVDGELPPEQAASVISALAEDPALARRIATLQRLKTSLASFHTNAPPLPALPDHTAWRWPAALAAAATGAIIAGAVWVALPPTGPDTQTSATAQHTPLDMHQGWASTGTGTGTAPSPAHLPDEFTWLTPVMRATGLQLAYADDWRDGLHLGYVGANACKLSLFIRPDDQPDSALDIHLDQHLQQASWTTSGLHFNIISQDMDTSRFATIATTAHAKSRDHLPASAAQIALINAARLPCLA